MKILIKSLLEAGNILKERVILKVHADTDIGGFLILRGNSNQPQMIDSGSISAAYWFPDKPVKSGDLIALYTKHGKGSEKKNASGSTTHFFYWGLDDPQWDRNTIPALLFSSDWQIFDANEKI